MFLILPPFLMAYSYNNSKVDFALWKCGHGFYRKISSKKYGFSRRKRYRLKVKFSFVDTKTYGFHEFIRVRVYQLSSRLPPCVYSLSPTRVSPTHVLATRRDWLPSRGSHIECVLARNFPSLSLAISTHVLCRHPLSPCLVCSDPSAMDRKEGKHRALSSFSLNDKRVDPNFPRRNYVILNARALLLAELSRYWPEVCIYFVP